MEKEDRTEENVKLMRREETKRTEEITVNRGFGRNTDGERGDKITKGMGRWGENRS